MRRGWPSIYSKILRKNFTDCRFTDCRRVLSKSVGNYRGRLRNQKIRPILNYFLCCTGTVIIGKTKISRIGKITIIASDTINPMTVHTTVQAVHVL